MWLSGQQRRPAENGEGQTGTVTMSEGELAVELDSERRGLELYGPAGYRWTPKVGERVLVILGRGETPCVVGTRTGAYVPEEVTVEAENVRLKGQVWIGNMTLEEFIAMIVTEILGGGG